MLRASALTAGVKTASLASEARAWPTQRAGNLIQPALFDAVEAAVPPALNARAVIGDKLGDGDIALAGAPPWRTAEPGDDAGLVGSLVDDIACWAEICHVK